MPIIKQAKKKMRRDKKRTIQIAKQKRTLRTQIKHTREKPGKQSLSETYSLLDKHAKKSLIHKNKAARLKSRLAKIQKPSKKT